ncbi:MAG: hypothetical protein ACD_24C00195G0003 [uncultured bacterium]|nr:MAG: hypothetical protein ACD_24C00195G0003 [uncultured bacterium]
MSDKSYLPKNRKTNIPTWIALIVPLIVYVLVFSYLTILRHNAFVSNFDLANMDQTIWNTLNGRFFSLSSPDGTLSRLSVHADFILILLSPIYLLWSDVRMLLITQTFFLAGGAIPIYLLARKVLKRNFTSLAISWLYLLYPGLQWVNFYDFHPVSLSIPFVLSAFYSSYIKKWGWYFFFAFLAVITKEEISLVVSMIGVLQFFLYRERKIGVLSFLVGLLWFPLMVFWVIPNFGPSGQHWAFDVWFKSPKDQVSQQGLWGWFSLFGVYFSPEALLYYFRLLKSLFFLPLLGFPFLLLSFPDLSINLLSSFPEMRSTILHYDSGLIPGLFIALIFGVRKTFILIEKLVPKLSLKIVNKEKLLISLFLSLAFFISIRNGPLPISPFCWCSVYLVGDNEKKFANVLAQIPPTASIAASREIRPHLSQREHAYNLDDVTIAADYLALIDQQRYVGNFSPRYYEIELIEKLKNDPNYQLVTRLGHYYLFKKVVY